MKLTEQELYAILKGLNMINNTDETKLSQFEIFQLQKKLQAYVKEIAEKARLHKEKLITFEGKTVNEWAIDQGVSSKSMYNRLKTKGHPYN